MPLIGGGGKVMSGIVLGLFPGMSLPTAECPLSLSRLCRQTDLFVPTFHLDLVANTDRSVSSKIQKSHKASL